MASSDSKEATAIQEKSAMAQHQVRCLVRKQVMRSTRPTALVQPVGRFHLRSFHAVPPPIALASNLALENGRGPLMTRLPPISPLAKPWRIGKLHMSSSAIAYAQPAAKSKQAEESVTSRDETHISQTSHTAPEAGPSTPLPKPTDPASLLPPSPLSVPHPTPPIPASSSLRALISDFQLSLSLSHLVPPNPTLPAYKRWIHIGKQLFKFYWNALKVLWADVGSAREIKRRPKEEWNRRETRLVKRTKADLWKLAPFVAILCILEELLPLLVLYAPNSMPSTTILPAQLIRIKDEEQTRRRAALVAYAKSVVDPLPSTSVISSLPANSVSQLCKILELGTFAPVALQRRRLRKHLEFLGKDDEMLRNEIGDVKQELSIEEKRLALAERGIIALYATPLELDAKLSAYLEASRPLGDGKDTDLAIKAIIETIGNEARSEAQRVETRVKQVESENKDD